MFRRHLWCSTVTGRLKNFPDSPEAPHKGARLVLFPEAFISGYPRGLDFGAVVGSRTDEGREDFRRYWESSVDVPGRVVDYLARTASSNAIYLIVGVVERDAGTLYCTVLFFSPDGTFLGKHRKVMPTGSERLVWGFGDGSTLPVYETEFGKVGAVICWENYLPLLRASMFAKGIEIYCAPTADAPAIPGWPPCATSQSRDAALSYHAINSIVEVIFPVNTVRFTAKIRTRSFAAVAVVLSTHLEVFLPDQIWKAKKS